MTRQCIICGKDFTVTSHNKLYCSKECYTVRQRQLQREYKKIHREADNRRRRERARQERAKKTQSSSTLDDTVAAAQAAGMSYGQYVINKILKEGKK